MLSQFTLRIVVGCLTLLTATKYLASADEPQLRRMVLTETYYATAKANVLREKTVVASYHIDVTDRGEQLRGRALEVVIRRVNVKVDVPAQKRKAKFDSTDDKVDMVLRGYELVRPVSFFEQRLTFIYNKAGEIVSIEGLDDVERKLSGLFNRNFSGTEVIEYALDVELDRAATERMARSWGALLADVLVTPVATATSADEPEKVTFELDAAVPSEVWITSLKQTCEVTRERKAVADGEVVRQNGSFKSAEQTKSKIGPCDWSYQITTGTFESSVGVNQKGRPTAASRRISAVLDTVITIGDRPIRLDMSVRHEWVLK